MCYKVKSSIKHHSLRSNHVTTFLARHCHFIASNNFTKQAWFAINACDAQKADLQDYAQAQ